MSFSYRRQGSYTPFSGCISGKAAPKPYLGPKKLKVLVLRGFIGKHLRKKVYSSIQIENVMEKGREISIDDFGFRSTFNEAQLPSGPWGPRDFGGPHLHWRHGFLSFPGPRDLPIGSSLGGLPTHHAASACLQGL